MLGGTTDSVFSRLNANKLQFHEIDDEKYIEAFEKYSIYGTDLSASLGLLEQPAILRESLPLVLKCLLERDPTPEERFAFMSFMVFDNRATIVAGDYMNGVALLKKRSVSVGKPEYISNEKLIMDRHRHLRTDIDPQLVSIKPVTGNAEYGWMHGPALGTQTDRLTYTLRTTDVTKKEGRSLADY